MEINATSTSTERSGSRRFFEIAIVCGICLLLAGPFVGKRFHVDDPMYLWMARQIARTPGDFFGFTANWDGHEQPAIEVMKNPPGVPYFIAAAAKVVGWSEVGLHAVFLLPLILGMVGFYFLADRYCRWPMGAVLLLMLCPAMLVSATTVMCEMPLICFWVWGILLWMWGSEKSPWLLPLAGAVIAAAVMCKYLAVGLLPLVAVYSLLKSAPRRTRIFQCASLMIPVLVLAGYQHYTLVHYGRGMLSDAAGFSTDANRANPMSPATRLLDGLIFVGGGASAVAIVAAVVMGWRSRAVIIASAIVFGLAARRNFASPFGWQNIVSPGASGTWGFYVQCGIFAAAGVAVLLLCRQGAWRMMRGGRQRDLAFLVIWIGGVFMFAAIVNWAINARSILPMLPAVCILAQRAVEGKAAVGKIAIAMIAAAVVAIVVTVADYQLAEANYLAAREVTGRGGGQPIWFAGHWGFQYYMQEMGARPVDERNPQYQAGDLVVVPLDNYGFSANFSGLELVDTVEEPTCSWITTMNGGMGANFYFSRGDRIPFAVGRIPPEEFLVLRVKGK